MILARVPEGFVAELTYGEDVNWYRNIIAAGGCTVVQHGRQYRVSGIERLAASRGLAAYSLPFRTILRLTGRETDPRVPASPRHPSR